MRAMVLEKGPALRRNVLLLVIAGVPLLFVRTLHDAIDLPKLGLLSLGVLLVLALRALELLYGADLSRAQALLLPAAGLLAPLTLSWIFSPYKGWSLLGDYSRLGGLLPYALVVLLAFLVADTFAGDPLPVAWALFVAGGISGGYLIFQTFGLDPFEWEGAGAAAASTLGNSNFAGGFLGMAAPLGIALWVVEPSRRVLVVALELVILIALLLSESLGGWAAGAAGLAVVTGVLGSARYRFLRIGGYVLALAIALAMVAGVVISQVFPDNTLIPDSIERRGQLWRQAIAMGAAAPIAGRGPNSFAVEGTMYRVPENALVSGYTFGDDPHSVPLAFFANAGIVGLIGFGVFAYWIVRRGADAEPGSPIALGLSGVLVAYLVQGLVSIDTVALRTAAWSAAGAVVAAALPLPTSSKVASRRAGKGRRLQQKKARPPRNVARALLAAGVSLVVVTGSWMTLRLLAADASLEHAEHLITRGRGNEAIAAYERALQRMDLYEYRRDYARTLAAISNSLIEEDLRDEATSLITQADELMRFTRDFPQMSGRIEHAQILRDWAEWQPSMLPQATVAYERAAHADPLNPLIRLEAAAVLIEADRHDEAVRMLSVLEEEIDLATAEVRAGYWGRLALAQALSGGDASSSIERALALDPEQADALAAREIEDA